mgnify:CR=1 FL=1
MQDRFGRRIHYLRLSVTDRCDFRCTYCLPRSHRDFATPQAWLTADEIARIVGLFTDLGVSHVRLTGGEPLVRKELPEIVRRLDALPGIRDLSLSTNASRMALRGDGKHFVSLDKVIRTMRQTGADMKTKYKETARGGLAVNVIEC